MSWTDERIALLKRMWKEGKSAAEIAKTLGKGVTRNAVIGKAHRMGLSGRPSPIKKPAAAPKKESARKESPTPVLKGAKKGLPSVSGIKNAALAREAEDVKKFDREAIPPGGGVPLIELTERMCKWPIGDPREPDFTFCGRTIRQGTPYCPDHAAAAYQTSSRSRAAAAVIANEDKEVPVVEEAVEADDDTEEEVG